MASHCSILAWRIPWTEEPDGLSLWCHKESDTTESICTHTHTHVLINNDFSLGAEQSSGEIGA